MSSTQPETSVVPEDIRTALRGAGRRLGGFAEPLHYFHAVTSTNDVAARLAIDGADEGTLVVADQQRAGRGRRGRGWFSPAGAGLYVSVVFRPVTWPPTARPAPATFLTLMAGVALAEGVRASTGLRAHIKWPNDLLVGQRKLAGILAEASGPGPAFEYVILGFGINVSHAMYPIDIADRVTSLESELGRDVERGSVLAETLAAMASGREHLVAGRFNAILTRWRELAPSSCGAAVEWTGPHGVVTGTSAGIDEEGALLVRAGSRIERVIGGEVTWV